MTLGWFVSSPVPPFHRAKAFACQSKRERLAESIRLDFTAELERYDGYAARLEAKGSSASASGCETLTGSLEKQTGTQTALSQLLTPAG